MKKFRKEKKKELTVIIEEKMENFSERSSQYNLDQVELSVPSCESSSSDESSSISQIESHVFQKDETPPLDAQIAEPEQILTDVKCKPIQEEVKDEYSSFTFVTADVELKPEIPSEKDKSSSSSEESESERSREEEK